MSPHCSAIFLQQSRSADVIPAPGKMHAATGSAASISARAETQTLINSFNITSLSTTECKTQQAGKGYSLPPSRDRPNHGRRDRGLLVSDTSRVSLIPQSRTESNTPTILTHGMSGNIVNRGMLSLFMFFKFIILTQCLRSERTAPYTT